MIFYVTLAFLFISDAPSAFAATEIQWSNAERRLIREFSRKKLSHLGPNDYRSDSLWFQPKAVAFGRLLFFDTRLSKTGKMACSTCHPAHKSFTDGRNVVVPGAGQRNVPTLIGAAWQNFLFWDGRKDSLWSQAIGPLTAENEHNLNAAELAQIIRDYYFQDYRRVFGRLPPPPHSVVLQRAQNDEILANIAKTIGAYVASLAVPENKLDRFAEDLSVSSHGDSPILDDCERRGLKIFLGKGFCVSCHNGPLLSNNAFHNTGVPLKSIEDFASGRARGINLLAKDAFNCRSRFSQPGKCVHVDSIRRLPTLVGAFKTPTLRSISKTAPYMHNGVFQDLQQVIQHYNGAADGPVGYSELLDLNLNQSEVRALTCFLKTL